MWEAGRRTGAAELDDADIGRGGVSVNANGCHTLYPLLDGIGDVGHHLHCLAQKTALALLHSIEIELY